MVFGPVSACIELVLCGQFNPMLIATPLAVADAFGVHAGTTVYVRSGSVVAYISVVTKLTLPECLVVADLLWRDLNLDDLSSLIQILFGVCVVCNHKLGMDGVSVLIDRHV